MRLSEIQKFSCPWTFIRVTGVRLRMNETMDDPGNCTCSMSSSRSCKSLYIKGCPWCELPACGFTSETAGLPVSTSSVDKFCWRHI